jgi:predicted PilT family ATPase
MATSESSSSAAERLLQQHAENHHVSVEDAPDEDLPPRTSSSAKGLGKPDTNNHEEFPELGVGAATKGKSSATVAPIWSALQSNGNTPTNGTPRTSTPAPASGVSTPTGVPHVSLPGRHIESVIVEPQFILPRGQLKRPIGDIVQDINRKSRAFITTTTMANGGLKVQATGPQEKAQQAIRDLVHQIGTKQSIKVPIPRSARAHIIGKQGSTIKALQEQSGARIQLPKTDESQADDDEDGTIDVIIEGNTITAAAAREAIRQIVGDRSANSNTKLRNIPAEFYPFIAGANNSRVAALETEHNVQIRVPPHQPWSHPVPEAPATGERPLFVPTRTDNHIQVAGERNSVAAVRAAIERQAQDLQNQLQMEQCELHNGKHQFIVGSRGMTPEQFFAETNCVIILPNEPDVETVTVIGLEDDVNAGLEKAVSLAMGVAFSPVDISRLHKHTGGGAPTYSRDVARYLRQRKEIERLEELHQIRINTPFEEGVVKPWELYAPEGKNIPKAQKELSSVISSHPPSRLATVPVDPFFHAYLRSDVKPRVQSDFGVHLVVPEVKEAHLPVLLVFEGDSVADEAYQIPQKAPGAQELRAFQQGLGEARKHILDLISKQEQIKSETLEVPVKFHEKLRKFIKKEQDTTVRTAGGIPVRVSVKGTTITMRGTASGVESLAEKARAFVEQEKEDEKERGFTLKFDFPQKHANHLIGKSGSHIKELREKFDVEIQVQNGEVELKGPKAKAERAKAHINSLAKTWADETTHTLKIEPKYHRELIGAQGSQITRLQTRYNVHINFPRTARPSKDDESVADATSDAGKPRRQQGPDEVVIRGAKKGADDARDEIFSLYQYLKDNSFTATVSVQQKQLPSLIGAGGSGMDELRTATGAKVDIPNERNGPQDALVEIQIKGTKTQVAAAKKMIEEKKAVFDDTVTKTVEVDRKWHKILIGSGGKASFHTNVMLWHVD